MRDIFKHVSSGNMFNQFQNHNDLIKTNTEELIRNLEKIPDINECEYVFIDTINSPYIKSFLEDKIVITQNKLHDFIMFEYDMMEKNQINEMTKINFRQVVDLVILMDCDKLPKHVEEIIDEDTIISKYLGNDVLYIEDTRNNRYTIITAHEKIILKQRGANTHIEFYKNKNA